MTQYKPPKIELLVSRQHPTCLSSLPSLFVIRWGTIKVILLSPPCSPLRDLLNAVHSHLICDQEYNGSGKLEGTVLSYTGVLPIQGNC